MRGGLSYDGAGATRPCDARWPEAPSGFRRFERTVAIGRGDAHWAFAAEAVLRWGIKTRSGFDVRPDGANDSGARVALDRDYRLLARLGPVTVSEPVRVVAVVEGADRCGFAYGTRPGHPVSGEEAFVVHRADDGAVWLTLRSLTRPAPGPWRPLFPALLVAQRVYRRRYERALQQPGR